MKSSVSSVIVGFCLFTQVVSLFALVGCGSDKQDVSEARLAKMAGGTLKDVVSVKGTVLVDGEPTAGVNLYLYPDGPGKALRQSRTGADGTYCWSTSMRCDGLEAGTYRIAFRHIPEERDNDNSEAADDLFKSRYSDPRKSEFKLTVEVDSPQDDVDYELKSN